MVARYGIYWEMFSQNNLFHNIYLEGDGNSMTRKTDNIRINISEGTMVERALKKFKRLCDAYGIVKEYRRRESYIKPSVKLKEKQESAEKRRKKTIMKQMRFTKKI